MTNETATSRKNGWLGGENQNAGSRQRETRWLTPPGLVVPLGDFDLDPCGAPGHHLAKTTYLIDDGEDGLALPWHGRVWLNPPYGRQAEAFLRRLAEHGTGTALIFARTETAAFHKWVWGKADAALFLRGRVSFLHADGTKAKANAGAPSVLVAYGARDSAALRDSGIPGHYVRISDGRHHYPQDH